MNNILYIGQYSEGTTSKMRADVLKRILESANFEVIDTHVPFFKTNQLLRSFGFRYKIGPLIKRVNLYIQQNLNDPQYDLIWVDKGVFINQKTIQLLRSKSVKLVHFTPDMAFYENNSKHFNTSIAFFDHVITTKSAELNIYEKLISPEKIIITTQGFDKSIHKPHYPFEEKDDAIVFIGLAEQSRIDLVEYIINNKLTLKLVGKGWTAFVKKNQTNKCLKFIGESVYSTEYSKLISSSKFALGLLSKRFPEFHTTRTFEIPACGTALLTEKNEETNAFFNENEVIFYNNESDLIQKVKYFLENDRELEEVTIKGHNRVIKDCYDYESILRNTLTHIL